MKNKEIPDAKALELAKRIRHRRIELNLSFEEISKRTGLSKSTLFRYEMGTIKSIPADKIELLAAALNLKPSLMMGWNTEGLTEGENDLLSMFNGLNEIGKRKALEYLRDLYRIDDYKLGR